MLARRCQAKRKFDSRVNQLSDVIGVEAAAFCSALQLVATAVRRTEPLTRGIAPTAAPLKLLQAL